MVKQTVKRTRKLSQRGNWIVVTYHDGEIFWAKWITTWAGVQASKREAEKYFPLHLERNPQFKGRVLIIDLERAVDLAATEGANEIADLERLFNLGSE